MTGIDIRRSGSGILFRLLALDSAGDIVTSGDMTLRLYRHTASGLESFDWDDFTFKTGALTTETVAMTHRTGNDGNTDTGVWTYFLSDANAADLAAGDTLLFIANHTSMSPTTQARECVYGGAVGDITLSAAGNVDANAEEIDADATAPTRLAAALSTANGIDLNMGQGLPSVPTADTTGAALKGNANLSAGFGSGNNTLLAHLRAALNSAAPTPTGLGNYDPATDSLEALANRQLLMAGAGFVNTTDSLQAIRDAIDTLVAPLVVQNPSVSGSGFLSDCIGLIRRMVDEPSTAPKYTNGDILNFLEGAFDIILTDMNIEMDHPVLVRYPITVVAGQQSYTLPPNVYQVLRVAKMNATTGGLEWEVYPGTEFSRHASGFSLEGNTFRLISQWTQGETIEILYVPNSEVSLHAGTAQAVADQSITLDDDPPDGSLDTRKNAYAGYMVRILGSTEGRTEERRITAYDNVTLVATLDEEWDVTPTGTVTYEVVPQFSRLLKHVVCYRAAMNILAQEKNNSGIQSLMAAFQPMMTALRRSLAAKVARFPKHQDGDTLDNEDRYGSWGGGVVL